MTGPNPSFPTEQQLIQKALDHVRAIFRGNGIKKDNIKVLSNAIAHHTMNAGTYLELKPVLSEKNVPGKIVAGQLTSSREDAMRAVDQTMLTAARDPVAKAQIANVLLSRPDQGFGLSRQSVPLDFLKREYTWHEACQTCRGTAQSPCQKCQGRRLETCIKCTGRGLMPCPMCRATGLLQGNKCTRCLGQRYVPCDQCQRSGMMKCRMCNATGVMKCTTCAGQGWKSHVLSLMAQAMTYFEYDAKSLPKAAADTIETQAPILAAQKKIKILGRMADDKENVLGASYEVDFPFGEMVFQLGKKEAKANLFGYGGDLVEFPYLLDKMLGPSVQELEEAANDIGSVADKIQKATRFRLIAQAFLIASKTSAKKTVAQLMKTYDIGLSIGMAEKLAILADRTTSRITKKPRIYGLILGLLIVSGLDAGFYLMPVRAKLAGFLPNPKFDFVLDIIPVVLGGFITMMAIQFMGAKAIRKALGHLTQAGQKNTLVPKAAETGIWGWACTVIVTLGMMEIAAHINASAPYWYEIFRNFALQMIGAP